MLTKLGQSVKVARSINDEKNRLCLKSPAYFPIAFFHTKFIMLEDLRSFRPSAEARVSTGSFLSSRIDAAGLTASLRGNDQMRILVIEDEKKVASFIKKGLGEEHYAVDTARDGEEGLYLAETNEYDLIILDLLIPKIDGWEVLRRVRGKKNNVPILVLTARDTVEDIVKGLDAGCDDYLTKPFAFAELLARTRALLRREKIEKEPLLRVADLILSPVTHKVMRREKEIELTSREYALLEYFMRNPDKVLTRTMISEHVWDYHFDSMTNVIDVYVNYLRKKVDKDFELKLIHTIRGIGYMMKGD